MDYNKFSEDLRSTANVYYERFPNFPDVIATYIKAANIIETLLAERDSAIKEIPRNCGTCKYESLHGPDVPCCKCEVWTGIPKKWEWCGLQKD